MHIVILAAGLGKRMASAIPKVLHPIAGKPMLERVIETAKSLNPKAIHIIYGHHGEMVRAAIADESIHWVHQTAQLGTAHAVMQALPNMQDASKILVLYADVPLISQTTLTKLKDSEHLNLLTACVPDPCGLGRIVRKASQAITHIAEQKDATPAEQKIKEIFSGILCMPANLAHELLPKIQNTNAQQEYYLTDIVKLAIAHKAPVESLCTDNLTEIQGVNDRVQLSQLERAYQQQLATGLMHQGVSIIDPSRFDCRGNLSVGYDVVMDVNVIFKGDVKIGNNVSIGPNCVISNSSIADNTIVHANCVIENSEIEANCQIGPFARLRPGTQLLADVKIGNFVEIKQSEVGSQSKINHLSYIGDTTIGERVNIGAGTITCNYDGANKHQTIIKDDVFIGSDSQLVAPVTIGAGATVAAGATVRKDAPAGGLTLNDTKQKSLSKWQRPRKEKD